MTYLNFKVAYLSSMVTDKKRIQAYVDLSTYESLKSLARNREMSLSGLVGEILKAHSTTDDFSNTDSLLTIDDLNSIMEDFRYQIISEINELRVQNETLSKSSKTNRDFSKSNKKKKRGFSR